MAVGCSDSSRPDSKDSISVETDIKVKSQIMQDLEEAASNIKAATASAKTNVQHVAGRARDMADLAVGMGRIITNVSDGGVRVGVDVAPKGYQWEYKVITPKAGELEKTLNDLGAKGWEVVKADQDSLLLKRRKQ
tara:strand:+ start:1026 stop:1430 length:405 start_codon:yes stop_codon:yes gene_type:complete